MAELLESAWEFVWGWPGLFFCAIIALAVCLKKIKQLRAASTEIKPAPGKEKSQREQVLNFLAEQYDKNKRLTEGEYFRHKDFDRQACQLRGVYLKIEEKNLQHYQDQKSYHLSINKALVKLAKKIRAEPKEPAPSEQASATQSLSDEPAAAQAGKSVLLHKQIEDFCQQAKTGSLDPWVQRAQYQDIVQKIKAVESVEKRVALKKLLLQVEVAEISEQPTAAAHNQAKLRDTTAADAAEYNLDPQLKNHLADVKTALGSLLTRVQALLAQSGDPACDENTTLAHNELSLLQNLSEQHGATLDAIEHSIKRQFASQPEQATGCIEQEIKPLRNTLAAIHSLLSQHKHALDQCAQPAAPQATSPDEIDTLKKQLEHLSAQTAENQQSWALQQGESDFIAELIAVESLEDLSFMVFQYFADQGCEPVLLINHKGRSIEMAGSGPLCVKDKTIINTMLPNEVSRDDEALQLQFRYQNIGGIVRFAQGHKAYEITCEGLLKIAKLTDAFIQRIGSAQHLRALKKQLEQSANSTKQLAQTVDGSFEQLSQQYRQSVLTQLVKAQNALRAKNAPLAQIAQIKQLETDILEELANNNSVKVKIRKEFLALVKKME